MWGGEGEAGGDQEGRGHKKKIEIISKGRKACFFKYIFDHFWVLLFVLCTWDMGFVRLYTLIYIHTKVGNNAYAQIPDSFYILGFFLPKRCKSCNIFCYMHQHGLWVLY